MNRTKPMKRRGKKTLEWYKARAELKKEFERMGITACELRLKGCTSNFALSFAHRIKRRFITTEQELKIVALACLNCHNIIEAQGHEKMARAVDQAIANRISIHQD